MGCDMYYLNMMAGRGERRWLICDDPAHSWVRQSWRDKSLIPGSPSTERQAEHDNDQ